MTSWSRRLSAANARPGLGEPKAATERDVLDDAVRAGVDADDLAALRALATVARERPGFRKTLLVTTEHQGDRQLAEFEVVRTETEVVVRASASGTWTPAPEPRADEDDDDGAQIIRILTDTLVETPDIVAVFASVGHEALWANDAFATSMPIREADKIWLVELLDEWSKGHYEVKVLPALVKYGRWRGRLTFLTGPGETRTYSAVIVAHRDKRGEIEAVSMVAREIAEAIQAADPEQDDERFTALVEHTADIIAVCSPEGIIEYVSPAAAGVLGTDPRTLRGVSLFDLLDPDDRPERLLDYARPDEQGVGVPVEVRIAAADGTLRHLEVIVTDLTHNPAIGGVVLNARDVTDRVRAISELTQRAYTDPLTGLPNRVRLLDRLTVALADGDGARPAMILLVDLDHFESLNAQYGREGGDLVLATLAQRLADAAPPEAAVARHSGDQFAIVVPGSADVAEAVRLANRLRVAMGAAVTLSDGHQVKTTVSVGIAVGTPGTDGETAIRDAGRALSEAKAHGRDRVEVYSDAMESQANRRQEVEQQLRHALDNDGIEVHYQPVIDIASGDMIAAEALLRVHGAGGELLSPAEFVGAAESSGQISRLGAQVLQATCEQLAAWSAQGGIVPGEVSVNISPRQLVDPELPTMVVEALNSAGIPPEHLWLEITESILITMQPTIDAGISYLRALGVKIGLDDFGAGQSSLGYLKRFPLDFVKIDRSLIAGLGTDEQDTAIVRATIELAHNLGLTVVAVGVENEEQLAILEMLGCERAQGYLFAPPTPAGELPTASLRS